MSKKEELERARAIAEIEAKFAEPEYKGEKLFSLIGIVCAGITVALAGIQLWNMVQTQTVQVGNTNYSVSYADRVSSGGVNPLSVIAPFLWCISCM